MFQPFQPRAILTQFAILDLSLSLLHDPRAWFKMYEYSCFESSNRIFRFNFPVEHLTMVCFYSQKQWVNNNL